MSIDGKRVRAGTIPFTSINQYSKELKEFSRMHNRTVVVKVRFDEGKGRLGRGGGKRKPVSNGLVQSLLDTHHLEQGLRINAGSEKPHTEVLKRLTKFRDEAIREFEADSGPRKPILTRADGLKAFNSQMGIARSNKLLLAMFGL